MKFKCLKTGKIMTEREVRRDRSRMNFCFPKDAARWDDASLKLAKLERVSE